MCRRHPRKGAGMTPFAQAIERLRQLVRAIEKLPPRSKK